MYLELLYVSSILSASWNFFSLPCFGAVSEWLLGELLTKPACALVIYQFIQTDSLFFLAVNAGLVGSWSTRLFRERRVKKRAGKGFGNLEGASKLQPWLILPCQSDKPQHLSRLQAGRVKLRACREWGAGSLHCRGCNVCSRFFNSHQPFSYRRSILEPW